MKSGCSLLQWLARGNRESEAAKLGTYARLERRGSASCSWRTGLSIINVLLFLLVPLPSIHCTEPRLLLD